jgi:hypothetical protein
MTQRASEPYSDQPGNTLEEWLQLPESVGDNEPHPPVISPDSSDESCEMNIPLIDIPVEETVPDSEPAIFQAPIFPEIVPDIPDAPVKDADVVLKGDKREVKKLEAILSREFGDTLTSYNALMAPVGITLLAIGLLLWMAWPLVNFLGSGTPSVRNGLIILGSATFMSLAGLHMIFYWLAHRGSNAVKSKELDRIIDIRRVENPCIHLDCEEVAKRQIGKPGSKGQSDSDLRWRCSFFDQELERTPLCAVCSHYEVANTSTNGRSRSPVTG